MRATHSRLSLRERSFSRKILLFFGAGGIVFLGVGLAVIVLVLSNPSADDWSDPPGYQPRHPLDSSGYQAVFDNITPWRTDASLEEYAAAYREAIPRGLADVDRELAGSHLPVVAYLRKASLLHARGDPAAAYQVLTELETRLKGSDEEERWLYTVIYYRGVSALRMGENDNCVLCRGESACIFPIAPEAVHANPNGSRLAIGHFGAYLQQFPDDLEVKWLLNLAHMTLGEYPDKVDPRHLLKIDAFCKSGIDIGKFRDIGQEVGLTRLNQSGGGILDDFDNDGLLDLVVTSWAPDEPMAFYRNKGDGTFEDRTRESGLDKQMGGLFCVQADYNNDGHLDVFVPRGSWLPIQLSQRPSLLRNNGNGTFTDVTAEAGLLAPVDSTSAAWADYDNDGHIDLFVCCRRQPSKLYHNNGNGTFEERRGPRWSRRRDRRARRRVDRLRQRRLFRTYS